LTATLLATEIAPLAASIAKALDVLPAVIEKLKVWFRSGSEAVTVPTKFRLMNNLQQQNSGCQPTALH
jgi:hypothetical protein